jgi:hypothetical protein
VVLTALSAAFFGSLAIYGKFADRMGIPLTELLAVRFGVAAVILWVLALIRRERLWWGRRTAGLAIMGLLYRGTGGHLLHQPEDGLHPFSRKKRNAAHVVPKRHGPQHSVEGGFAPLAA